MMTQGKRDKIVAALTDDGDRVEVDGRVWTLKIKPDECTTIFDEQGEGVWCGRLEWSNGANLYGWPTRPDWADGGAEILDRERNAVLWWRPLEDCLQDRELRRRVRSEVLDYYRHGYSGVILETDDGYTASLWGLGPFIETDDYLPVVVGDLVWEIADEIQRDEEKRAREIAADAMFAVVGP